MSVVQSRDGLSPRDLHRDNGRSSRCGTFHPLFNIVGSPRVHLW